MVGQNAARIWRIFGCGWMPSTLGTNWDCTRAIMELPFHMPATASRRTICRDTSSAYRLTTGADAQYLMNSHAACLFLLDFAMHMKPKLPMAVRPFGPGGAIPMSHLKAGGLACRSL